MSDVKDITSRLASCRISGDASSAVLGAALHSFAGSTSSANLSGT